MTGHYSLGKYRESVEKALAGASRDSWAQRIWTKDTALWKKDTAHAKIIANSLGWLTVAEDLAGRTTEIKGFADEVREKGFATVCLLGMGGSSLCPEVCAFTYGKQPGFLDLVVLDTTDPAAILEAERSMDLARTLFLVASKSGSTIESASLQKYFYEKLRVLKSGHAGRNFIAVTDPGTSLEKLGKDLGFRRIFLNMKDIGGRYSALSLFGLVPMALIGLDIDEILARARRMMTRCRSAGDPNQNPGLSLGVTLGALALEGRDKLTLVLDPEIRAFGYWVEQLVAESTGKEGRGILPVEGEIPGVPSLYQNDRVFVRVKMAGRGDPFLDAQIESLSAAGHPVLRWELQDKYDLGGEFFLWEYATAAAGSVLSVNPFDQPNVQESKDNTQRLIHQYVETGRFEEGRPIAGDGPLSLYCPSPLEEKILPVGGTTRPRALRDALAGFFNMAQPHDYVAILAYIERSMSNSSVLEVIRERLRDDLRAATTLGFGPRFLHSTGQLHKGGANNGLFLQITAKDAADIGIPGERYSFGTLKQAQSIGDLEALVMHRRRAIRLHISGDVADGLDRIAHALEP